MRNIYTKHIRSISYVPTQGSIFVGAVAEDYPNEKVLGLIITAKCDMAHKKVSIVHYLPLVRYDDWFLKDGLSYLQEHHHEKINNKLIEQCSIFHIPHANMSADQLKTMSISITDLSKKNNFNQLVDEAFSNKDYNPTENDIKKMVENLCTNKLENFYIIEDWENPKKYYVILLREVKSITYDTALKLQDGIDNTGISEKDQLDRNEGFYYIEQEISSPYVEHILERFTHNFARIGVPDMKEVDIQNIQNI